MAIETAAFVLGKDIDSELGTIYFSDSTWFLRVRLEELGRFYEGSIALTGDERGAFRSVDFGSTCLRLAPGLQFIAKTIGSPTGPAKAPVGALAWSEHGLRFVAGKADSPFSIAFDGTTVGGLHPSKAFFTTHWGLWVANLDGQAISDEPAFVVQL